MSGLSFAEFCWIITGTYATVCVCVCIYLHIYLTFVFVTFARKKVNLLQQQKITFNSKVCKFPNDLGDISLSAAAMAQNAMVWESIS